jgi:hypothetical protein
VSAADPDPADPDPAEPDPADPDAADPDAADPDAPPPAAQVIHDSPGRLRLKLPDRRGETGLFAEVGGRLAQAPGVAEVRTNARTASILILHESDRGSLMRWAETAGVLQETARSFAPFPPRPAREPGWRTVLAVLVAVLAVVQLFRGQVLGPFTTLAFMAAQIARLPIAGAGPEAAGEGEGD